MNKTTEGLKLETIRNVLRLYYLGSIYSKEKGLSCSRDMLIPGLRANFTRKITPVAETTQALRFRLVPHVVYV